MNDVIERIRSYRNAILIFLVLLIGMMFTAQVSFQRGFSRGALEWRDAKGRFFIMEQQNLQNRQTISALRHDYTAIKLEHQHILQMNAELQEKIASTHQQNTVLAQENLLYKKILAPEFQQKGIQINSVQIYPMLRKGHYRYEVLLAKFSHHKTESKGNMQINVQGVHDEESIQLPVDTLLKEWPVGQPYLVRYFQSLNGELQLPDGFAPESIQISLVPKSNKEKAITEDFPWIVSAV